MQLTISDELAVAARLAELSDGEARRAWIIGLFAERRLSLVQAAQLAGFDRISFQRYLASHGIALLPEDAESGAKNGNRMSLDRPWLALRGSASFIGDPFAPAVSEAEIVVLQKDESGVGS